MGLDQADDLLLELSDLKLLQKYLLIIFIDLPVELPNTSLILCVTSRAELGRILDWLVSV